MDSTIELMKLLNLVYKVHSYTARTHVEEVTCPEVFRKAMLNTNEDTTIILNEIKNMLQIPKDVEIERILSMSDEELVASATPLELEEAAKLSKDIKYMSRCFDAGWNAAINRCASLITDSFELDGLQQVIATLIKNHLIKKELPSKDS